MSFDLVAHDKLKQSIKESIISLIKYHHPTRTVDPDKLNSSLVLLPDDRRAQADFLLKVVSLTEAMSIADPEAIQSRARILNAAVLYIFDKIAKSYDEGTVSGYMPSFLVSPEGSNFYKSLRTSLGITAENIPNDTDKKDMYTALRNFLLVNIYKQGKAEKGYLDEGLQAFSSVYQYKITEDIEDLSDRVALLESNLRRKAEKLHKESLRPAASSGLWGWFSSSSTKPVAPATDETAVATAGTKP